MEYENSCQTEAQRLACILHTDLNNLAAGLPISSSALTAPRRRNASKRALAAETASLLFPPGSLHSLIKYERAIVLLRAFFLAQEEARKAKLVEESRIHTWAGRIEAQGPWDELRDPLSLEGPAATPMPVKISLQHSLAPFFEYLADDGDFNGRGDHIFQLEPYYDEPYIEFERGVLYKDQRMDLCKMWVSHFQRVAGRELIKRKQQGGWPSAHHDASHCS
jgi:hypothetical protein